MTSLPSDQSGTRCADRRFEPIEPPLRLTHRLHQLLEDDAVLCNVELLARQPV